MLEGGADVGGRLSDISPVATFGYLESVDLWEVERVFFAVQLRSFGRLVIPDVADPLEEEQGQDVALPVGQVDGPAALDVGGFPQVRLQIFEHDRHRA